MTQVKTFTEMESHEEKLHKMIIQSKINDTKDVMKRKAMELDKSKAERAAGGGGFGGGGGMGASASRAGSRTGWGAAEELQRRVRRQPGRLERTRRRPGRVFPRSRSGRRRRQQGWAEEGARARREGEAEQVSRVASRGGGGGGAGNLHPGRPDGRGGRARGARGRRLAAGGGEDQVRPEEGRRPRDDGAAGDDDARDQRRGERRVHPRPDRPGREPRSSSSRPTPTSTSSCRLGGRAGPEDPNRPSPRARRSGSSSGGTRRRTSRRRR